MEYLISILGPVLLALWRVTDGGWHRLPKGSSAFGIFLACAWGYIYAGTIGLGCGAILAVGLLRGYQGWNDPITMAWRALPSVAGCISALLAFAVSGFFLFGMEPRTWAFWVVALPSPILFMVAAFFTPWLRKLNYPRGLIVALQRIEARAAHHEHRSYDPLPPELVATRADRFWLRTKDWFDNTNRFAEALEGFSAGVVLSLLQFV